MLTGSMVALATPLRNNVVDYDALERLIEWQIKCGTDAILVCGSTGEGLLLSEEERGGTISASVEIVKGRVPVIVGCSSCWTVDALKLTSQAKHLKADAVLLIAPYYVKPTQHGIIQHFTTVHENSNIPIVMYNNPGRCAVDMTIDTIVELSKLPRVVALKDSNTNLSRATFLKSRVPDLILLSGDDPSLPGYLAHGGDGCISVAANVAPTLVKKLVLAWKSGDTHAMQTAAAKLAPLSEAMFVEPNPIPVKYALSKLGFTANELRSPLTPATRKTMDTVDAIMAELKE
ncbi:MAG: 4-hydroxy-tetrahydrodipicolinate synthase [Alphaproteobacteria bacterium]|nr:4-hydroxy-tetrahydrodipicolinate synthase [Alphaproteobacteria bacterium]